MNTILNVYYPSYYINDSSIGAIKVNSYYKSYFNENMTNFMRNQKSLNVQCDTIGIKDGNRHIYWNLVKDMTNAFENCKCLTGNAVEADNVVYLRGTYKDCTNLTGSYCGNNTESLDFAYYNCSNLQYASCKDNVLSMSCAYYGCIGLQGDAVCGKSVEIMNRAYEECTNLKTASCGSNVKYLDSAYYNCISLNNNSSIYDLNNVISMRNAFYRCSNFHAVASCGKSTTDMGYAYYNCSNLTGSPVASDSIQDIMGDEGMLYGFEYAYYGCSNLIGSPVCPKNVTSLYNSYGRCFNLTGSPVCGEFVTNMDSAYLGCYSLSGKAACGNNVITMNSAYKGCGRIEDNGVLKGISSASCSNSVLYMDSAYASCYGLSEAVIGKNVIEAQNAYLDCFNIRGKVHCWYNQEGTVNLCSLFSGRDTRNHLDIYVKRNKSYDNVLYKNTINNDRGNIVYTTDGECARKFKSIHINVGDTIPVPESTLYNNYFTIDSSVTPPIVTSYSYNVIKSPTDYFYANIDYVTSNINGTLEYYYHDTPGIHWTDMTNGYYNTYWNINVYNNLGIIGYNATGVKNLPTTDLYKYNGNLITPTWRWFDGSDNIYKMTGQINGTEVGTYTATVELNNSDYEWENSSESHTVTWYITPGDDDLVDFGRVGSMRVREKLG